MLVLRNTVQFGVWYEFSLIILMCLYVHFTTTDRGGTVRVYPVTVTQA